MGIHVPKMENIGFFEGQIRIALRNCGQMEFSSLEAYVARDGYAALAKALHGMSQEDVVTVVKDLSLIHILPGDFFVKCALRLFRQCLTVCGKNDE